MAWKKFDPKSLTAAPNPALVTVNKDGALYLNPEATELLDRFGPVEHVELFYDDRVSRIGIQPVDKPTDTSYAVSSVRGQFRKVTATRLLRSLGIPFTVTQRFPASWNAEHRLLAVDLRKPLPVTAKERARRARRTKDGAAAEDGGAQTDAISGHETSEG